MLGEGTEDGLMRAWMSGPSQFQTLPWCGGGVMSARRKHRALNGITRGDVNLERAGGELNMIRGLQSLKHGRGAAESEEGGAWRVGVRTAESQQTETPLQHRVVHYHFCSQFLI